MTRKSNHAQIKENLENQGYYLWLGDNNYTKLYNTHIQQVLPFDGYDRNTTLYLKQNMKKIYKQSFKPNQPEIIMEYGDFYSHNIYRAYRPKIDLYPKTDWTLWNEYWERLFPNETERHQIVMFLAHIFQKPEERPSFALMLTSEAGTGKGVLYDQVLRPLLCNQTMQYSNFDGLFGKHSEGRFRNMLVMLDDAKSDHPSTMTRLKSAITEPTFTYEAKHQKPRTETTYARILLASNEAVPLKLDETSIRRWFAPSYIRHRVDKEETQEFMAQFIQWVQSNLDQVYHWFIEYDISDFNHKMPLETATLLEMVENTSASEVQSVLEDEVICFKQYMTFEEIKTELKRSISYADDPIPCDREIKIALENLQWQSARINLNNGKKKSVWHEKRIEQEVLKQLLK